MNLKTLNGPSIQAALAEARRQMGDDVVLLESEAPVGDRPARITVMVDEQATMQPASYGYGTTDRSAPERGVGQRAPAEERAEASREKISGGHLDVAVGDEAAPAVLTAPARTQRQTNQKYTPRTGGRGRLFPQQPAAPAQTQTSNQLERQLAKLSDRLARMEQHYREDSDTRPRWTAHPLFAELLHKGLRPATLTTLFDEVDERGLTQETDDEELRWAVAQGLRRRLRKCAPPRTVATGTVMLVGPGGAGKTSMLLKLATSRSLFGRNHPAVIAVLPEDADTLPHANPAEVYRRFGLPVQSVTTSEEMQKALDRVQGFDQVLIDTPPLPLREQNARRMLARLHRLVGGIAPLHVQLVLDATRSLDEWEPAFLKHLPLKPEAAVLTHLDETRGWGRLAEWLMAMELPVPFVSDTPRVPDGAHAFSPTWFVEELLDL